MFQNFGNKVFVYTCTYVCIHVCYGFAKEKSSHKALSHGAIFLATCNAILLLGDVKLANTCFHHSLLVYFLHTKHLSQSYIS